MEKYVLDFSQINKQDICTAGGKGANLGEMVRAGIPVPDGAVLTIQAYDRFLAHNGIDIAAITGRKEEIGASAAEIAEAIRAAFLQGEIPSEICEQILAFYCSLGTDARAAVRSSATAEDLEDASFAGQQETYLNVIGETALLEKIKACYASLWSRRAVDYRNNQGYGKEKASLAVVIQQMVESDSAGVVFTSDPAGDTNDVLINASYGLGEAVVSGLVSPDEYVCDRAGTLKRAMIGSKEQQVVYGCEGIKQIPVPVEKRKKQVLTSDEIQELVRLSLGIEAHYGHPMDIEWAIKDGRTYILQARSITTIREAAESAFCDADFAGLPAVKPAKGRMRENMLFNLEKLPKPYFPLDHDFGDAVGRQKEALISKMGIKMNEMCPIDADGISSFCLGGMKLNRNIIRLPRYLKLMKNDAFNIDASDASLQDCTDRLERERAFSCASIREVGESLERMLALIGDTSYARFRYAVFPQVFENMSLNRMLKRVDKDLHAFDMMEGLSYVTADVNREMAEMTRRIRGNPKERKAVMGLSYSELTSQLPELRKCFNAFMEKYGNRSDFNCYCFISKSWNDDPDRFLETLRTMLRSTDDKVLSKAESEAKFETLMELIRANIGRKAYARFKKKVAAVRHYHYIREATQYLWESEFAYCRELLKKGASILSVSYDELLYLFADELFALCRNGHMDEKTRELIAKRKAKRPLAQAYWSKCIEESLATKKGGITGVSGSVGSATGKVCVVKNHAEFNKMRQGEILVCAYTDPEWTPLFTLAAGVVVDTGGTLSHAAIVAREYHIPAVLAVGDATKKLKDGDLVIVDGTKGIVTVLQAG